MQLLTTSLRDHSATAVFPSVNNSKTLRPKKSYNYDFLVRNCEFSYRVCMLLNDELTRSKLATIFTTRRSYAGAVLGVVILSVCPSV